jgi:hypothetical protein
LERNLEPKTYDFEPGTVSGASPHQVFPALPPHPHDQKSAVSGSGPIRPSRTIERCDFCDVFFVEVEIEHVEILFNPGRFHRFRDHDESAVEMPSDNNLSDGFAVLVRQLL